ncbi:MAG: hypothetical protein WBA74_07145, partial [Cyclobacteriaceae bacterium]
HKLFIEYKDPIDGLPKNKNDYASILMNPTDNPHLSKDYIHILENMSERAKRRFLHGLWDDEIEGALWSQQVIDRNKIETLPLEHYERIIIAVDPAVTAKDTSDETGIIVGGLIDQNVHIIDDASGRYAPLDWANKVKSLYYRYKADRIICETNQGGDLVEQNLLTVDNNLSVKKVHAYKGKYLRAEPVASLYERDRVKHIKYFNELEEQMVTWRPAQEKSPDRLDALVYAVTELLLSKNRVIVYD